MKKVFKWFFISLLTIITLGIPTIYLIILNSPAVSATWYDDSWGYRKRIDTTIVSNSSDLSNLQMLLTVDTSTSGIASGKMQSSCQDLRFTNTNGKVLPYYIDSGCTTTTTKIWVMVDLVPKNTTSMTLFMYYGNPSAPAGSNSQPYFDNVVGLVGYWNMNDGLGNPADHSITGNSSTLNIGGSGTQATTTQAWSNGSSGKYSTSLNFDGTDDYVSVADNNNLHVGNILTLEAWVKTTNATTRQTVIGHNNEGNTFQLEINNGGVQVIIVGAYIVQTGASLISNNTWAHIVYTRSGTGSGTHKVYVNGASVALTTDSSTNFVDPTTALEIGRRASGSQLFPGQIDDVKIYNTARSAAQILNDYNNKLPNGQTLTIASTAPTTVVPTSPTYNTEEKAPSPIAYWKFDDGQGQTAQDSTTTNADGTLAGTTVPAWKTEDLCISGKCLYFDGLTSKVTVSKVLPSVQTVSMWVRPNTSASTALIDLDGGTHKITTNASSVLSASGFDTPTIYVNGKVSSTLTANSWNYVTITTATSFASTSSLTIGNSSTTYFNGFIDEVKIYPYARSAAQISTDYNSRGNNEGASSLGGPSTSSGQQALSNGLVGYWKMDESSGTLADASGNSNTGTWNGTGTTHYSAGKFGNGGGFNGSNDYVSVGNPSVLGFDRTNAFGACAWINQSNLTDTSHTIISKLNTSNIGWEFTAYDGGNTSNGLLVYLINTWPSNRITVLVTGGILSASSWQYVCFTYDGSSSASGVRIYLNGVKQSTTNSADTLTGSVTNSVNVDIGNRPAASTFPFNGSIDEVRIYNRALSPQEVSALYNFAPGPKVYLKMDEGTGTSANDSSGNSNNATVNTGTWTTGKYGKGVGVSGSTGSDVSVPDFSY